MDPVSLTLTVAGTIILLLLTVLGFFLARVITDVKNNTSEIGKNKGRIELAEQQQINDSRRIEQMTQLELRVMSEKVGNLADNVNLFVAALAKKGLASDDLKNES